MYGNNRSIDVDKLRNDMENESLGAFWGGGFGGAIMEASDIRKASDEELIKIAKRQGKNLDDYQG